MERTQEQSLRIAGTNYILSNHHAASFRFKCGVQIYIKGNELLHALHPQIVDDVVVDMSINNVFIQATRYVQNLCKYVKQIVQ